MPEPGARATPSRVPLVLGAAAGVIVLATVVVLVIVWGVRQPVLSAGAQAPVVAGSAVASGPPPGASGTPRAPTGSGSHAGGTRTGGTQTGTEAALVASPIYAVALQAGASACPGIELYVPPLPDDRLAGYARQIVACMATVLAPALAEHGIRLTAPKITIFGTDTSTPCGVVHVKDVPALYCPDDHTIYLNERTDDTRYGYYSAAMGYWFLLSHEFGHQVQEAAGIFPAYRAARAGADAAGRDALSRDLELQATCFGGVFLNAAYTSLKLDEADYQAYVNVLLNYADEETGADDHGTGANQRLWFDRGYGGAWGSFGECNTWAAPAAETA